MSLSTPHQATVQPYTGSGAEGRNYGPALQVPCYVEGATKLVRSVDGNEVVAQSVMFTDLRDDIPPLSRVLVPAGDWTWVISVARFDDGGALAHLELALA